MSKKRWFFLWLLFIGYLFLGAFIFYKIERDLEEQQRSEKHKTAIKLEEILVDHIQVQKNTSLDVESREKSIETLFDSLSDYCARPLQLSPGGNATLAEPYRWTFYNSFFFALTTLSTIGYGNLSPNSEHGKLWVILYSLIGIPFNGIVLTHLGEFFGSKFLRAHHRYKTQTYESRVNLIIDILVYLIPGILVFILGPSFLFAYAEKWTFIESVYFSFVSLTTIGYGDFVAGQTLGDSPYDILYKVFLVVWVMFGLGYLVMILGFISRALRSKKINKLERKVAQTLKHTQSKIWNEFVHDVHYLRRVLNEMYLLKVRPVYKDRVLVRSGGRSRSCPELREWPVLRSRAELEETSAGGEEQAGRGQQQRRRRAFSENGAEGEGEEELSRLQRVLSDGALHGIDVQATFSAPSRQGFLFPSVIPSHELDSEDCKESGGGVNLFSAEEILADEEESGGGGGRRGRKGSWWLGGDPLISRRRRGRAMSEAQVLDPSPAQQKTWAGAESLRHVALLKAMRAKSHELPMDEEKGRRGGEPVGRSGFRRLSMAAFNFLSPANKLKKKKPQADINRDSAEERGPQSHFFKSSPKHRLSLQGEDSYPHDQEVSYLTQLAGERRMSLLDLMTEAASGRGTPLGGGGGRLQTRGGGGGRRASEIPFSPVLEQTSIADFIRALQTMQSDNSRSTSPIDRLFLRTRGCGGGGVGPGLGRPRGVSTASLASLPQLRSSGLPPPLAARRFSQVPTGLGEGLARGRAASLAVTERRPTTSWRPHLAAPLSSSTSGGTIGPIPPLTVTSPGGRHTFIIQNVEGPQGDLPRSQPNK